MFGVRLRAENKFARVRMRAEICKKYVDRRDYELSWSVKTKASKDKITGRARLRKKCEKTIWMKSEQNKNENENENKNENENENENKNKNKNKNKNRNENENKNENLAKLKIRRAERLNSSLKNLCLGKKVNINCLQFSSDFGSQNK